MRQRQEDQGITITCLEEQAPSFLTSQCVIECFRLTNYTLAEAKEAEVCVSHFKYETLISVL